jgi:small subunit ribosomal protein S3
LGHKVHPIGFRIGVIRDWQAKWYTDKHYAEFLDEDMKLRDGVQKRYAEAAISLVEIERQANKVAITIHTSRPGIVIGRGGQRVDETRGFLEKLVGKKIQLNIQEIQRPELDAYLVAKNIAEQIERRIAFRRAMKQTTIRVMQAGAKGVRVSASGRLGGAEIARRLTMHEGQVPLHTLRADIDYGFVEAKTVMGRIGIKVWIYKGDILPELKKEESEETAAAVAEGAEATTEAVAVAEAEKPAVSIQEKPAVTTEEEAAKTPVRRRRTVTTEPAAEAAEPAPAAETAAKAPVRKRRAVTAEPAAEAGEVAPSTETETTPKAAVRKRKTSTAPETKEEK